jgi:hypothetical protein
MILSPSYNGIQIAKALDIVLERLVIGFLYCLQTWLTIVRINKLAGDLSG